MVRTINGSADEPERIIHAVSRSGPLADYLRTAPPEVLAALYAIIAVLVFDRITRPAERRRGHYGCASSPDRLEPDCRDRYQDDIAAVRDDVLRHATKPIANLEGWIVARLRAVTVDAHRRRRGERDAQQRPRLPLPAWLAEALHQDKWLQSLAVEILIWVGHPIPVPTGLWPLNGWADRRIEITGDSDCTESEVAADVETVLAAMRTNPRYYDRYVEMPLGRKRIPVAMFDETDPGRAGSYLALVAPHETADARLLHLAADAVDAIADRIRCGEDPRVVVVEVIGIAFGCGTGAESMDQPPSADSGTDEMVAVLLADPATVDRVVATVLDILGES